MKEENNILYQLKLDDSQLKEGANEASKLIKDIGKIVQSESTIIDIGLQNVGNTFVENIRKSSSSLESIRSRIKETREAGLSMFDFDPGLSHFEAIKEQLEIQKKTIWELENSYKEVFDTFNSLIFRTNDSEIIVEREKASKLFKEISAELNNEKIGLQELEKEYDKLFQKEEEFTRQKGESSNKQISIIAEMKQIQEEMAGFINADGNVGKENLARYDELKGKLSEISTAYHRVQEEQKLLTNGDAQLAGIIQGISGLEGALSVVQKIAPLFTQNNEMLLSIQSKLQQAMAITIGLQKVSNTLHATSSFRIATVTKATQLFAAAQTWLANTFKISDIASKRLLATLTLGLSVALTAVVSIISKYITEQENAAEVTKKFNESVSANVTNQIIEYERLRAQWIAAKDDLKKKEELVRENIEAYNSFGVKIRDVKDTENLFINNADNFRDSILARAKALAAMELAKDKYIEYVNEMAHAERRVNDRSIMEMLGDGTQSLLDRFESLLRTIASGKYVQNKGEEYFSQQAASQINSQAKASYEESMKMLQVILGYDNEANASLVRTGMNLANEVAVGSKNHWQKIRDEQQKIMDELPPESDGFKSAKLLRNQADRMLTKFDETSDLPIKKEAENKLEFERQIAEEQVKFKKEQARKYKDLEFEVSQARIDALQEGSYKELEQIKFNHEKENEQLKRNREDFLQNVIDYEKNTFYADPNNKNKTFDSESIVLPKNIEDKFSSISDYSKKTQANELSTFNKKTYDDLLNQYRTFEEKRNEIALKYIDLRGKAIESGNIHLIDNLYKAEKEESSKIALSEFQEKNNWEDIIGDLDRLPTEQIKKIMSLLEAQMPELSKVLVPQDIKVVSDALDNLRNKFAERAPIESAKASLQNYKIAVQEVKQAEEENNRVKADSTKTTQEAENAEKKLTEAQKKRKQALSELNNAINEFGNKGAEWTKAAGTLKDTLEAFGVNISAEVSKTIEGIDQMFTSIASIDLNNPATVVTGVIGAIGGLAKSISGFFGGADYSGYNKLKEKYDNLLDIWDELLEKKKKYLSESVADEVVRAEKEALDLVNKQTEAVKKLAQARLTSGSSAGSHSIWYRMWKGSYKFDGMNWQDVASDLKKGIKDKGLGDVKFGSMSDMLDMTADQLQWIKENYYGLWAAMDGDFKGYLEQLIQYGDQANDIIKQAKESLTQVSFDSMKDSFLNTLLDMDSSAEDFAEDFAGYLQRAMMKTMLEKQFTSRLQSFYDQFAKANEDGIDENEYKTLQDLWKGIADNAINERDKLKEIFGWASSEDSRKATEQGVTKASQDSIDYMNGMLTNIQLHTYSINGNVGQLLDISRQISASYRETLSTCGTILLHTANIDTNTQQLHTMRGDIAAMRGDINNIVLHGISLNK